MNSNKPIAKKNQRFLRLPLVTIKRQSDSSLDELFGYDASDVENEGKVQSSNNVIVPVLSDFEKYLGLHHDKFVKASTQHILLPLEINQFLQLTLCFSNQKNYFHRAGWFLSQLIQNSYDVGHNDFILDYKDGPKKIDQLGRKIIATKERPCTLYCNGNAGYYFGERSQYLTAIVKGLLGPRIGNFSQNLTLTVNGNISFVDKKMSSDFTAYVSGRIFGDNSMAKIPGFFLGDDATTHPEYIRMMQNFDEVMGK
jgi:hypothetical protein